MYTVHSNVNMYFLFVCTVGLTMGSIAGGGPAHAKAIHVQSMTGDVLLRLEHDDVDFRSKHASQHHKSTQTDRYAHGRGLDLR